MGQDTPSSVLAEIALDVSRLADNIRREWESLRPEDVVFLLAVQAPESSRIFTNGGVTPSDAQRKGLQYLRAAEITQVLDDNGRPLRDYNGQSNGHGRARTRRLQIKLDANMFKEDMARVGAGKPNIYENMNVVLRRRGRENNFKPILESIRSLTLSDVPLAPWLHEVFLGYGDPAGATYSHLSNRLKQVDYRDTFLDWQHLIESLPGKTVEPSDDANGSFGPPYVLQTVAKLAEVAPAKPSKKRRRGDVEPAPQAQPDAIQVGFHLLRSQATGHFHFYRSITYSLFNRSLHINLKARAHIQWMRPDSTVFVLHLHKLMRLYPELNLG